MAFTGYESWEAQYFEPILVPEGVHIPLQDNDIWMHYPELRWLYNKMTICELQGIEHGPYGVEPQRFPVFSKPIYNLWGMGIGSKVVHSVDELRHDYRAGHFWMEMLEGAHLSTDCAVIQGDVEWMGTLEGVSMGDGRFDHWTVYAHTPSTVQSTIRTFVANHLPTYTGMLNVETIGGTMIEIHPRLSAQYVDLWPSGWLAAVVRLYSEGVWNWHAPLLPGFSVPLWTWPENDGYRVTGRMVADTLARFPILSVQPVVSADDEHEWEWYANPDGNLRLALVNSRSLEAARSAIDHLADLMAVPRKP